MARLPYMQNDNRNYDFYDTTGSPNMSSQLIRNAMMLQQNNNNRPVNLSFNRPVNANRRGSPFALTGQHQQYGNNHAFANTRQSSVDPQLHDLYMRTKALENASASFQYSNLPEDPRIPSASTSRFPHNGPFINSVPYGNDYQHRQRPMPYHRSYNQFNQQRGGYRGFQGNHMHRNGPQFPSNNSWGMEYEPIVDTQPEEYGSAAIILWFNGSCGELLCCRNLKQANVHFYFDGRTLFNEQPLALDKDDPRLQAGSKVEFECFYKHPKDRDPSNHSLFHVKAMKPLKGREIKYEESVLSVDPVFGSASVTSFRTACDKNFQSVLIHPSIFTKEIIARQIREGGTAFKLNHNELRIMKSTLTGSRTVTGTVGIAPRWFTDVIGEQRVVKKFLISCKPYEEIQEGEANIVKLYYAHETREESKKPIQALLQPVNHPDVLIPFSTLHLDTRIRIRFQSNRRVKFVSCRELPGMTYEWRALDVSIPECEGDMITSCRISSDYLDEALADESQIDNQCDLIDWNSTVDEQLYEDFDNMMPCASASKSSNEVSYMAELLDLDWSTKPEELNKVDDDQETFVNENSGANIVADVNKENTRETPILDTVVISRYRPQANYMRVCGTSPYEELSYEICHLVVDYSDGFKFGDEPHEHKVIDVKGNARKKALKKEKEKAKEDEKEVNPAPREDWTPKSVFEQFMREENARRRDAVKVAPIPLPSTSSAGGIVVAVESSKRVKSEPLAPIIGADVISIPDPAIRVIGIYDDIGFLIGNRLKVQEECRKIDEEYAEKKRERSKTPIPEPTKPSHDNGFWFRRKEPRLYPTVLVSIFVKKRNRDLDEMDIDVNLLAKTVVIRDQLCTGVPFIPVETPNESISPPPKEVIAPPPPKENVDPLSKECATPAPPPENKLADMLKEDKIFGSFFGSLLNSKKNMK